LLISFSVSKRFKVHHDVRVADRFVAETVGPGAASRKRKKIARALKKIHD